MKEPWTLDRITSLRGQEETILLEFKAGALFDKPQDQWIDDISREVSAFANTEGGTLVLGVKEERVGKTKVAGEPDGVGDSLTREQLQRLIEGNLRPDLPGIHIERVRLESLPGRAVFVVSVPQGSTAYQAKDRRYYGRSELEVRALLDNEIRLRMARGRVARATLEFHFKSVVLSTAQETELRKRNTAAIEAYRADPVAAFAKYTDEIFDIMQAQFTPDAIQLALILRNNGELTIRDPVVTLKERKSPKLEADYKIQTSVPERLELTGEVLYPDDERVIEASLRFQCRRETTISPEDYRIEWKVFLDNSQPSAGALDLGVEIQAVRAGSSGLAGA